VDDLFARQARELDRTKREALLHSAPEHPARAGGQAAIYHLAFQSASGSERRTS